VSADPKAYPKHLMWADLETTGVPVGVDWSDVHLLEIAVIVTDFALNPLKGYQAVIRLTPPAADALRHNDYVRNMHKTSGLLEESIKSPTAITMEQAETEVLDILEEEAYIIAGSGVAAFDHPFIKAKMPRLDSKLAYYPFDVGIARRMSKILAGRDVVNPTLHSYGDAKEHRALADIKAHLAEGETFRDYFRNAVVVMPTH
jgi:oligoribonuclease (3'-5' exoribonuclease)